ncbi:hypothetical protein RRG08_063632 [Elysia crispata]|uniref:Uncharacterized protein n=1 Tax=Elysia crispata TaxID=231223 RepID=A0AAE1AJX0_9GAST|nr:hypothetical protein RRG08_063632 [Elysia crispata]
MHAGPKKTSKEIFHGDGMSHTAQDVGLVWGGGQGVGMEGEGSIGEISGIKMRLVCTMGPNQVLRWFGGLLPQYFDRINGGDHIIRGCQTASFDGSPSTASHSSVSPRSHFFGNILCLVSFDI